MLKCHSCSGKFGLVGDLAKERKRVIEREIGKCLDGSLELTHYFSIFNSYQTLNGRNLKLQKLFDISSSVANSGFRAVEHVQPSLLLDLISTPPLQNFGFRDLYWIFFNLIFTRQKFWLSFFQVCDFLS